MIIFLLAWVLIGYISVFCLSKFEDGQVAVPKGAGLGVELDKKALAKLHQNYVACGLTKRNDEIEMQKVQPGWTFKATRW